MATRLRIIAAAAALSAASCGLLESRVATLHTDIPEMALYAAAFNVSQDRYRIHVVFDRNIAETLTKPTGRQASMAVSGSLKGSQAKNLFQSLDHLFSELMISPNSFYPSLLELGSVDGRQVLLPVSFNLPIIIFGSSRDASIPDNFVIGLEELKALGAAFNAPGNQGFTKMGFGLRWYPEFMYEILRLSGAQFGEASPLKWDRAGLEKGLASLRSWTRETNGSATAEDDFQFKYLYLPEHRSVQEGRIAFSYLDSARYFTIPEERRNNLSFRWLARESVVPVADNPVYVGILRQSNAKTASEVFLKWFFQEDTQHAILEDARRNRSMESSFGIAGGFSALKSVNEKFFPLFYPSLLGKLPPASYLKPAGAMPSAWQDMKKEVLLPFLLEATSDTPSGNVHEVLEQRLALWLKRKANR